MRSAETSMRVTRGSGQLAAGLETLGRALDAAGVSARVRFQAELVFEELVTNVIRYGYDEGEPFADIEVRVGPADVVMVISDAGRPFNPLERAEPTPAASLAEASIGGLGISLVRKATSDLRYERADGVNRLTAVIPRDQ
jgi:serine/threonine-protein kinase RsbW